jgi:hypothetical protein
MRIPFLQIGLVLTFVLACGRLPAQTLPPPRVMPMPSDAPSVPSPRVMPPGTFAVPPFPPPAVFYRPSAYQVWQYYDRTALGYFRPRVIDATGGAYYLYRGIPYPWVRNYPGEYAVYPGEYAVMPLARD